MTRKESKLKICIFCLWIFSIIHIPLLSRIRVLFWRSLPRKLQFILEMFWATTLNKSKKWLLNRPKANFLSTSKRSSIFWLFGSNKRQITPFLCYMPGQSKGWTVSQQFWWTNPVLKWKYILLEWPRSKYNKWKKSKKPKKNLWIKVKYWRQWSNKVWGEPLIVLKIILVLFLFFAQRCMSHTMRIRNRFLLRLSWQNKNSFKSK